MSIFQKATKEKSKLRCAIFGPSGAGKTYTALSTIKGMAGKKKVALIDTERGSASKYADRFNFDVVDIQDKSIPNYVKMMREAASAGYEFLIIDSLTHAWQELLEDIDRIAKTKYRGNSFAAWKDGSPKQKLLVNAILDYPGHIIATMRSKTEYVIEKSDNGKMAPTRVGLAPEQGKGIEYEFDLLLEMNPDHMARVLKDRTGKFQDAIMTMPGEDFGKELMNWLSEGKAPAKRRPATKQTQQPQQTQQQNQATVPGEQIPQNNEKPIDEIFDTVISYYKAGRISKGLISRILDKQFAVQEYAQLLVGQRAKFLGAVEEVLDIEKKPVEKKAVQGGA